MLQWKPKTIPLLAFKQRIVHKLFTECRKWICFQRVTWKGSIIVYTYTYSTACWHNLFSTLIWCFPWTDGRTNGWMDRPTLGWKPNTWLMCFLYSESAVAMGVNVNLVLMARWTDWQSDRQLDGQMNGMRYFFEKIVLFFFFCLGESISLFHRCNSPSNNPIIHPL